MTAPWRIGKRIALLQATVTGLAAVIGQSFFGSEVGFSCLLGGILCIVGTAVFAGIMFCRSDLSPQGMLIAMCLAEFGKIIWVVLAFVLCFWLIQNLHAVAFLLTYIGALLLSHLLSLLAFADLDRSVIGE
ncbi:MAG: ATP synthase subunit I [Candidatus Eutrophobiaceae bacterium]